jgi:hypothetical protein
LFAQFEGTVNSRLRQGNLFVVACFNPSALAKESSIAPDTKVGPVEFLVDKDIGHEHWVGAGLQVVTGNHAWTIDTTVLIPHDVLDPPFVGAKQLLALSPCSLNQNGADGQELLDALDSILPVPHTQVITGRHIE